jgi:hypothetical protein
MVKEKSPQTKSSAEAAYKGAFGFKPSEKFEKFEKLIPQLHLFSNKQFSKSLKLLICLLRKYNRL